MRKSWLILIAIFIISSVCPHPTYAIVNPLGVPNNKIGIHIIDENDLVDAAALTNSSGGDWGYVTIVLPDNERKVDKWNRIFLQMQTLHLIPIVRIATHVEQDSWVKPDPSDADKLADFLNSLSWPTRNRYVVLFNEPNHAKEWGGETNPESYVKLLQSYHDALKNKSQDFFVLPAGMDASAPDAAGTMDEKKYLAQMTQTDPKWFTYIDGWTSHSYPNPGFSGYASDDGRGTVKTYEWELDLLKTLGNKSDLPVFITETGWPHIEGDAAFKRFYTSDEVTDLIQYAADNVWTDSRIVAVTPFVLNYQSKPFINFSWRKPNSDYYYSMFDMYRSIPKIAGSPEMSPLLAKKNDTQENVLGEQQIITVTPSPTPVASIWTRIWFQVTRKLHL